MKSNKSTDPIKLEELVKADRVILTPCKNLRGQHTTSYDDQMILDMAVQTDGAVISNDSYNDLVDKNPGKLHD